MTAAHEHIEWCLCPKTALQLGIAVLELVVALAEVAIGGAEAGIEG